MQGQQAGGCIERSLRRVVDIAVIQTRARCERPKRPFGQLEHLGRRVDAVEGPARMGLRKCLQLQPASGAKNQHFGIFRDALRKQERRHALHGAVAGHETRWSIGVASHRLRIGEWGHPLAHAANSNGCRSDGATGRCGIACGINGATCAVTWRVRSRVEPIQPLVMIARHDAWIFSG